MATKTKKSNKNNIILKDCTKCISAKTHNGVLYCKLRVKDDTIYTESAKVTQQDCIWFNEKGKNGKTTQKYY